jgi:hypothetical protein
MDLKTEAIIDIPHVRLVKSILGLFLSQRTPFCPENAYMVSNLSFVWIARRAVLLDLVSTEYTKPNQ